MKQKIEGIDVSHWNDVSAIDVYKPEFVLIKLSEGKSFYDFAALEHRARAKANGAAHGFYHYARAEKNLAVDEAKHFVSLIPEEDIGSAPLVLDYEGKSLSISHADGWSAEWCRTVFDLTGVLPMFYASQSCVARFKKTQALGCGLWVARYRSKILGHGNVAPWKFAAIWQYASKPIDKDIFYGTREQFFKYGRSVKNGN